jgi:hypothetical protein
MALKVNPKTGKVSVLMPKALGPAVDLLYDLRKARQTYQATVDAIKAKETEIKDALLKLYGKAKIQGASGKLARAEVNPKDIPRAEDWPRLYAHIKKTGDFDLLQKRLSDGAIKERWDAKRPVPGVGKFTALVINVTKKTR